MLMMHSSCSNPSEKQEAAQAADTTEVKLPQAKMFGTTDEGEYVFSYLLENEGGLSMNVITYGGIIQSLKAPDKDGKVEEITIGFDKLVDYEADNPFFGALIGRYGNRIAKGKFTLNGTE